VASHVRKKRLLWVIPVPGTSTTPKKVEKAKGPSDSNAPATGAADRAASSGSQAAAANPAPQNGNPTPAKP